MYEREKFFYSDYVDYDAEINVNKQLKITYMDRSITR